MQSARLLDPATPKTHPLGYTANHLIFDPKDVAGDLDRQFRPRQVAQDRGQALMAIDSIETKSLYRPSCPLEDHDQILGLFVH